MAQRRPLPVFLRAYKGPRSYVRPLPHHTVPGRQGSRFTSTQTSAINMGTRMSPGTALVGQSGKCYVIQQILQEKENYPLRVYLAQSESEKFVLKNVADFEYLREIYRRVDGDPYLRLPQDSMVGHSMFVYKYLTTDFLKLPCQLELPLETTKRVFRDALQGLAVLHANDIVHNGNIKANNILVDQEDGKITDVRLGDIEDAAIVPEGSEIAGRQLGNWMWRSPESHAEGPLNSPSDVFSFAIVCIYAVHKKVIFAVDESELGEGEEKLARVIERQISFFADQDSIQEFLHHISESPWAEIFRVIRDGFNKENPRRPFALWKGVDPVFKDLVLRMTHFNPDKRITAREALAHEWFKGI
ncbi:conserved hypothetical protein [Microsporum canis CBS 113480]|uniref:Protein kinase domain-containing protein n=1 Tax=Arthroderma otae (strain ATCC MYA-4605 / CBS 113480) TaxID=554155 RepID=C5FBW9_ARTOC|nr:conserved hypothetical protein [Microsporum canis CBS 113480]EEQ27303.1 conserved hypothetical protein [Microsporum canis CBS 113480]